MGNPKGDWGPTRDPRRNAQITAQNLPGLEKYINQQIPILLGAWQQQVDDAITDAAYPVPPESKVFWWIALGGNLLWAATSLLNPAVAAESTLIILMSHVGGVVAAGAAKKVWDQPDTSADAKTFIRQQIAKARGELDRYFQEKRREWGSRFERLQDWGQPDNILLDQFNAYIWKEMFPSIPYDVDRFDRIRLMAIEAVQSAIADYTRQWTEFKRFAAWYGENERKKHNTIFRPVLRIRFGGKPLWNAADVANSKYY